MVDAPGWFERKQGLKVYKNTFRNVSGAKFAYKKKAQVFSGFCYVVVKVMRYGTSFISPELATQINP